MKHIQSQCDKEIRIAIWLSSLNPLRQLDAYGPPAHFSVWPKQATAYEPRKAYVSENWLISYARWLQFYGEQKRSRSSERLTTDRYVSSLQIP